MPIGTLDYVSTAPWNDPYNPWPLYSQVSLSAVDINPVILTLESFDPDNGSVTYANYEAVPIPILYMSSGALWTVQNDGNDYYYLNTTTRAVPAGWLQGNTNWDSVGGEDVNTLSIVPVTTWLNPWEFRRRRLLEYV
jgi:hypothetical protein